jgi:hypothetical protein
MGGGEREGGEGFGDVGLEALGNFGAGLVVTADSGLETPVGPGTRHRRGSPGLRDPGSHLADSITEDGRLETVDVVLTIGRSLMRLKA